MTPRLMFIVPAFGRFDLTAVCLRQLRRTCDALAGHGIHADAIVVADDGNLDIARLLDFGTIRRNNDALGRRFNDGIQLACDPRYNPLPADYVVPCGSDDWVDHRILHRLPAPDTVLGFQHASFVSEDGRQLSEVHLNYRGGVGVRVYPRALMALLGYRPAEEDRKRACDTSILIEVKRAFRQRHKRELRIEYGDQHPSQVVDWKSPGEQINAYVDITSRYQHTPAGDPFDALTGIYPAEALAEMARHYALNGRELVAA